MKALLYTLTLLLLTVSVACGQNTGPQNPSPPSTNHSPLGLGYVFVGGASDGMGLTAG